MNWKRSVNCVRACAFISSIFTLILLVYTSNQKKAYQQMSVNTDSAYILPIAAGIPCRWPPKNLASLIDPYTGFYDLSIQIKVKEDAELAQYLKAYYGYLSKRYKDVDISGSFLKRLVQMDSRARVTGSINNYHLYPQFINMEATVEAVKECRQVKQHPIYNPKLLVLRIPAHVCPPRNLNIFNIEPNKNYQFELIVFIKSCVKCIKQRQRIRSTFARQHLWIRFKIRFVFVVGIIPVGNDDFINIFKTNTKQTSFSNKQFTENNQLFDESNRYNDLLIGNFHDTYNNLTLKQIFTFHWIALFCQDQSPLFLFLDDDHSIVPSNLIRFIRQIPPQMKTYFAGGASYDPQKVVRPQPGISNKFAIDENDFPWSIYAPYPTGSGYLLGMNVVQDLAIASRFTLPFRLEDVYLGILLFKLKHTLIKIPEMLIEHSSFGINRNVISAMSYKLDSKMDWKLGKIIG